jgi:TetR/AcrR family transcriptional regulator, mexJK operon transcriptional repressor
MAMSLLSEDARRARFVAAARAAFFTNGYAGTTMSSIAAAVGGSKTTLWSYFPSKQDLFTAVVDDIVETYGQSLEVPMDAQSTLESGLRDFGRAMMDIVLSQPIIDLHRLVIGEAGRFPELATLFFERGAKRGRAKLSAYIAHAMDQGHIRKGDPSIAARHFAAMCQSGAHQNRILGMCDPPDTPTIDADIDVAVCAFLHGWAPIDAPCP